MISRHDELLTNPVGWHWTLGMEHDPVEPESDLLPGRVDASASVSRTAVSCCVVGQFDSQLAAATAADQLSGICVARTVILADVPYTGEATDDEPELSAAINRLKRAGAALTFVTDADTGYMHSVDIRARCGTREQALAIGRQMIPIQPPFLEGLVLPWAPGRMLSEEQVRARMYLASLERSDQPPRDELESNIWEVWRKFRDEQMRSAARASAGASVRDLFDALMAAIPIHRAAVQGFLGAEPTEMASPWYLHWMLRVEDTDVCLSSVWCLHLAAGLPALVRWLRESGVERARYSVYNLMRP